MRSTPRYPVDRYLVESSNKIEMVNIIDDEIWKSEPCLAPEDEIILRKLHDMLQSTADDLKLLSGELAKFHQPGVQVKSQPLPLDEEFNEKIHIEELVNAKFHGYKIIDKPLIPKLANPKPDQTVVREEPIKKPVFKNLAITRTRILEIDDKNDKKKNGTKQKLNNGSVVNLAPAPTISYNEFTYKEPRVKFSQQRFKLQDMPSINIRSELKVQKVLQLDIFPDNKPNAENPASKCNVAVVAIEHESVVPKPDPKITLLKEPATPTQTLLTRSLPQSFITKQPVRKISKMSTCESSESPNISSDTLQNIKTQKQIKSVLRSFPKPTSRDRSKVKKTNITTKEPERRTRLNTEEWKKKLNIVYGQPITFKNNKTTSKPIKKHVSKKHSQPTTSQPIKSTLNNAEYIPYSHLTLGGVRVSDIERELSDIPNKNDLPLSPILDKILSSKENSFHKDSPRRGKKKDSPRIFTTSDENLLQEVIEIENKVSKTIGKNIKENQTKPEAEEQQASDKSASPSDNKDSYADDFEDENTENSNQYEGSNRTNSEKENKSIDDNQSHDGDEAKSEPEEAETSAHNRTYIKKTNLSIKNPVDVFEYVHSVDTQDTATQSNTTHKISLKETQTSPRNDKPNIQYDKPNIQPIHNDLWPMDPKGEVEKMFKLEKDFIKKLILEEYGEFLEKSFTKPSTSKVSSDERLKNETASQKLTQTSPAHVKSVMTSPTKTKTRTTSPFLSVKVDNQTSPMIVVTNEEHLTVELDDDEEGISINLSSPRFSLRLPQTSREVLSNLEVASASPSNRPRKEDNVTKAMGHKTYRKSTNSTSSSEVENSSGMSSLGEVKLKLKRRVKKKVSSISESSESSSSKYSSDVLTGSILPLRSEGEVSLGQLMRKVTNKDRKSSKSEGETSVRKSK